MTIELMDLDVPYTIKTNVNDECKDIVEILANSAITERDTNYDIALDYDGCQELIRVLQFVSNEIKPSK